MLQPHNANTGARKQRLIALDYGKHGDRDGICEDAPDADGQEVGEKPEDD